MISADAARVRTVLKNIIENGLKYSRKASAPVRVTLEITGRSAVVSVIDQGIGIPPEEIPFVCEPFFRVDKSRTRNTGGFGLGLSLCKSIMEAHAGKIELESSQGGTTVRLHFPV